MTGALLTSVAAALDLVAPLQSVESNDGAKILLPIFFLVGLFLVYDGFDKYRVGKLIENTPTERVQSIAMGRTELHGAARAHETVFDRPFTDGECLYADWKIVERKRDQDGDYEWRKIDSGTLVAPFLLEDETGSVLVDATDGAAVRLSDDNETTVRVDDHETPSDRIERFVDAEASVTTRTDRRRRYVETALPPGSNAYVFGGAREREDGTGADEDRIVIGRDDGTDRLIVSDMAEDELADWYGWQAPAEIAIGLGLSAGMLLFMLGAFTSLA